MARTYKGVPIRQLPPDGQVGRQYMRTRTSDLYRASTLAEIAEIAPARVAYEATAAKDDAPSRKDTARGFSAYVAMLAGMEASGKKSGTWWIMVSGILQKATRFGVDGLSPKQAEILAQAREHAAKYAARKREHGGSTAGARREHRPSAG